METRGITCCYEQELRSNMIVNMNVEETLKKLDVSSVKVEHTTTDGVTEGSTDLFVIGADLAPQMTSYKNKIVLNRLMDINEIETKLKEVFGF